MIALMAMLTASTITGCYGKFNLTRKIYDANGQVSDKFLRSGLTWVLVIIPVYGVAALVDFVVFNTVEFWTGSNPVALGEKDFQYAKGDETFKVHASRAGDMVDYTIKHYNKAGLMDTTMINWNAKTGKSVVTTNEGGQPRDYVASRDGDKFRIDQYAKGKLQNISWYTPQSGSTAGQFAAAR
jgi:hypothetical protein